MKSISFYFLVSIAVFAISFSAPLLAENDAEKIGVGDYEVHEWGVLAGCSGQKDYFVTSRPLKVHAIREPIVYIHSKDKKPFSLHVQFNKGNPTESYPPANVTTNSVSWANVQLNKPQRKTLRGIKQQQFVPLNTIMPVLNDVDADELYYQGFASRFLFYEGNIPFNNQIKAEYNIDDKKAKVQNNGKMPVYDVLVVAPQKGSASFSINVFVSHVEKLNPGETVTKDLSPLSSDFSFGKQLVELGFTKKEALSFDKLWKRPFLSPINTMGWGHLVYRLSDEEYGQITELQFNPKPKKCIRALYVLVRSSAQKEPQKKNVQPEHAPVQENRGDL